MYKKVTEKFFAGLEEKTGWGYKQVKRLYMKAVSEAAIELLDERGGEDGE
jgi:hypothetical protein